MKIQTFLCSGLFGLAEGLFSAIGNKQWSVTHNQNFLTHFLNYTGAGLAGKV